MVPDTIICSHHYLFWLAEKYIRMSNILYGLQCTDGLELIVLFCIASFSLIPAFLQEEKQTMKFFMFALPTFLGSVAIGIWLVWPLTNTGQNVLAKGDQLNFLAVVIALAAYTSTVLGKINRALKKPVDDATTWSTGEWEVVKRNHSWLWPGDVLLVLISLLLMWQFVIANEKPNPNCLTTVIKGLFAGAVLYLGIVHGRQWVGYIRDFKSAPSQNKHTISSESGAGAENGAPGINKGVGNLF